MNFRFYPNCYLFAVFCILASPFSHAEVSREELARSSYWLALGHYRVHGIFQKSQYSFIEDKKFFLSEQGATDPMAELLATIESVNQFSTKDDMHEHPVC